MSPITLSVPQPEQGLCPCSLPSCRPAPAWGLQEMWLSSPAAPLCLELCCGMGTGVSGVRPLFPVAGVARLQNNHQVTWDKAHCVCQPLREGWLLTQPGWYQRCLANTGGLGGCPAPLPVALQALPACCGDSKCTMVC